MPTIWLLIVSLLTLFGLKKYMDWRKIITSIHDYPGIRFVFGAQSFIFTKRIPYLAAGNLSLWTEKHQDFVNVNADIISSVRLFPSPGATYFIADAEAIKEITSARARFPKPLKQYKILTFFGSNIVVTEADEWTLLIFRLETLIHK